MFTRSRRVTRSRIITAALLACVISVGASGGSPAHAATPTPATAAATRQAVYIAVWAYPQYAATVWQELETGYQGVPLGFYGEGDQLANWVFYGQTVTTYLNLAQSVKMIGGWTILQTPPPTDVRMPGPPESIVTDAGSSWNTATRIGAKDMWSDGYTGANVDVAIIDTGVAPLPQFDGRLVNGPDLSFDASSASGGDPANDGNDAFGHGTHVAGLIAGREGVAPPAPGSPVLAFNYWANSSAANNHFVGIAPSARLINVRTGAANGAVDVSQIIAAVNWVTDHKDDPSIAGGLHIRVLNLSYGTDGNQRPSHDPLAAAVERAWKAGITVVVSAGNDGYRLDCSGRGLANCQQLSNPALDPWVLAVGASDSKGTRSAKDDTIADFSTRAYYQQRQADILAPGTSLTSLAVPGSTIDSVFPGARVGSDWFRGSGTSQAAGVVSGAVALLYQYAKTIWGREPTPSELKAVIVQTKGWVRGSGRAGNPVDRGQGEIDLDDAARLVRRIEQHRVKLRVQSWGAPSRGDGTLEGARGSSHVSYVDGDGNVHILTGEVDVTGAAWDPKNRDFHWSNETWDGHAWRSGDWQGHAWRSRGWADGAWEGSDWEGHAWRDGAWVPSSD
jgi:serine protease AprX